MADADAGGQRMLAGLVERADAAVTDLDERPPVLAGSSSAIASGLVAELAGRECSELPFVMVADSLPPFVAVVIDPA